jgi:hypothetical protein
VIYNEFVVAGVHLCEEGDAFQRLKSEELPLPIISAFVPLLLLLNAVGCELVL